MKSSRLEQALGYRFQRPELLRQALTHRSYGQPNNERLEFLGDSVLSCVIAAELFQRFPGLKEGELHLLRVSLVRQDAIADLARQLFLGEALLLGEGELKTSGLQRPSILSDALEAVFGALFLDGGYEAAREVILRLYASAVAQIKPGQAGKDAKTALQEFLQGRHHPLPRYALLQTRGEAHAQEFEVECVIADLGIRTLGKGTTRRNAEQDAARQALSGLSP